MTVSKVQARILCEMVKTGLPLKHARGSGVWITLTEVERRFRVTTLLALLDRGLLERCDTESTPWYRKDYVLTEEGRNAVDALKDERRLD